MISVWTEVDRRRVYARAWLSEAHAVDAPPIVLVHGLGVSGRYMIPTAGRLAPHARIYAPDLPGFGRSAKPPRPLNVEECADALAAWMRANNLTGAALIANSFGCQVVVDLTLRHPSLVGRAILIAPTIDPARRTPWQQVARFLLDIPREPLSLIPIALWDYFTAGILRGLRTLSHALQDRIEEKLPHMDVPTLVVCGERDPIVPRDWAEQAARLLPAGKLHVIPGAAHAVNFNSPEELVRVALPFLRDGRREENRMREADAVSG
ncbi:MAG TPA: alpha/beta hydrolase [Pyrinomonadaceae bacterium]|nr:alpha/beta hydrolase [Pyrinomonadaceae bacterium]